MEGYDSLVEHDDELRQITDFCRIGVARTGVDSMTVSFHRPGSALELVVATDDLGGRMARLQVSVGQGPLIDTLRTQLPSTVDDLEGTIPSHRWPQFADVAAHAGIRAVHAYPILLSDRLHGVVGFYARRPQHESYDQHRHAAGITELIGLAMVDPQSGERIGSGLRMIVHRAAGMLMEQRGISIKDALVLLRSTAFAEDMLVTDLAADVVARRRRLGGKDHADE